MTTWTKWLGGLAVVLVASITACSPSQRISTEPIQLSFDVRGSGKPIIMLHGFGATRYEWRHIAPALSARYQLFMFDLKGAGRSPKPPDGRYSVRDQSELISRFIFERGLKDITLIGHSLGGAVSLYTAVELMARAPGVLSSLVLIDAPGYNQEFPFYAKVLATPLIGPVAQRLLPIRFQVRVGLKVAYYDDSKITQDQIDTYAESISSPGGRYALREIVKDIVPEDLDSIAARYPTIKVPTLILWGRHDEMVPFANGERLHRDIPGSQFVVIEGTGHTPGEETPEPLLREMLRFLTEPQRKIS